MKISKPYLLAGAAVLSLGIMSAGNAQAEYPDRTISLMVGFSAGGPVDITARQVQPFLEKHLGGANIAVINRPGASSALMQQEVANAEPDGYTLALASMPGMVAALFGGDAEYSIDDFDYLGTFTSEPHSLIVGTDTPYEDLDDLVEQVRQEPQSVTMGGAGLGSAAHLALLVFEREAGVRFNFIPGPGAAEMRNQIMGGHIDGGLTAVGGGAQMHEEGQGRVLGVMGAERFELAPDLPTFVEQGYDVEWGAVRGLAAPAGLPDDVREKLITAIEATLADPEFIELTQRDRQMIYYLDAEEFAQLARTQYDNLQGIWDEEPWIEQ